ncbi:MAG: hypothetical protein IT536_07840 [Hyphomicrobiales bacterium]|nr:hypothetical protein [Hyphomicrobiales bacterium]
MSDPIGRWIPGFDSLIGTLPLPLWAAGALTALFVVFCAVALSRAGRDGLAGGAARLALVLVGAMLAWFLLDGSTRPDAAAERRALEARASALTTRATMPGSALACLDAMAGDTVEDACERALFATPEAMAAAVSYVAAQVSLFADVNSFARRGNPEIEPLLIGLRRAIESDRYGLVAHVLATRDGCTATECLPLAHMRDGRRVADNLSRQTYQFYVTRHASAWPASAPGPTASAVPSAPSVPSVPSTSVPSATQPLPPGAAAFASPVVRPPGPGVFFPSSDSIPAVSIMTAEPGGGEPDATGAAPVRTPPRRPVQAPSPRQPPIDLNATARGGAPPAGQ